MKFWAVLQIVIFATLSAQVVGCNERNSAPVEPPPGLPAPVPQFQCEIANLQLTISCRVLRDDALIGDHGSSRQIFLTTGHTLEEATSALAEVPLPRGWEVSVHPPDDSSLPADVRKAVPAGERAVLIATLTEVSECSCGPNIVPPPGCVCPEEPVPTPTDVP